jgi:bifunctional ADP-heptose synthase (sugar kinase/adenylyltransferase)
MKPSVNKILTKLSKNQVKPSKINLSVISDAKQVVREAGDEIDFVDKLQNEIMDDLRKIEQIGSKIKSNISGLDNAKGYLSEIKNSMKQIQKAADELGADFKNIQEWRLLDSSIDVIADLESDNKRIKQDAKKYIK